MVDQVEKNDANLEDLGNGIILPSSYVGSARNLHERYLDSMASARFHGVPDLLGIIIANPKWPELQKALRPHEHSSDCPDLVSRVFEMKRKAMINDIFKEGVLGAAKGRLHCIEFQKTGSFSYSLFIVSS